MSLKETLRRANELHNKLTVKSEGMSPDHPEYLAIRNKTARVSEVIDKAYYREQNREKKSLDL